MADERNQNLSPSQQEFLLKHRLLSHMNNAWVLELLKERKFVEENGKETILDPVIKTKHNATKNFKHMNLKCAGCLLGKMKRRPDKTTLTKNIGEMILKERILHPGQFVHSD